MENPAISIVIRLGKVIYVVIILFGLIYGLVRAGEEIPKTFSKQNEIVHCLNGKSFDPSSKPIIPNDTYPYSNPAEIRERQISSECQFGTAYFIGNVVNLDLKNHTIETKEVPLTIGTWSNVIFELIVNFFFFYLIAEIGKRTLRFIFFGNRFFK